MNDSQLEKAILALKNGDVVGMPTETVYGLAADIRSQSGIEKIFSLKRRPFFDPLIVHVASKKMAENLTSDWHPLANFLAEHFWPGPLTMVLPKNDSVNEMITSGLSTVGIRMPKHSLALSLIKLLEAPVAAPSANLFGKTSPTTAAHVLSEFKTDHLLVLDGGPCEVGLESTVLLIKREKDQYQLSILRAGGVTPSELEKSLRGARFQFQFIESVDKKESPGHMKHHYMPDIPLVLVKNSGLDESEIIFQAQSRIAQLPDQIEGVKLKKVSHIQKVQELVLSEDARVAARSLYAELRHLSEQKQADILYFRLQKEHQQESWQAIMDRLTKAASIVLQ